MWSSLFFQLSVLLASPYLVSAGLGQQPGDTDLVYQKLLGECPSFPTLPVPSDLGNKLGDPLLFPDGTAHKVSWIGRGSNGCVYRVESPSGQVVAAAKTVSGDGKIEQNEIDSLQSIGEYYGETYVSNGARSEYHVVFMAYHHGIPLYKTAGWQEFVSPPTEPKYRIRKAPGKDRQKCEEFFALATELVALRAKEYASKGVYHKDLNLRNVLFQPDYPKNQLIAFVDWGLSERTSDPDLVYTEVKKQYIGRFKRTCDWN